MFREPLLVPALALCLGIAAGHFCYMGLGELALPLVGASILTAAAYWRSVRRWIRLSCVSLTATVVGVGLQSAHRPGKVPQLDAQDGEVVVLSTTPTSSSGMVVFALEDVYTGDTVELDQQE